ncbi:MAG TPA: alpha/beta hydrolase [Bryobacteraceae bacterium]|nr:alpha/beta hydrolase [Bryobacteraceae bacterium]
MRSIRVRWYVAAPAIALAVYAALSYIAHRAVFHPAKYPVGYWGAQALLGASDVWINTSDHERLHAWSIPREGAPRVTLHLHGNAGNITHWHARFREIRAAGTAVLALDYRGYGKSSGRPTETGLYSDAEAAYDYLVNAGYRPDQIVVYGESLGTAIAVDLASRRPCAGVILESPFTSARQVANTIIPILGPLLIWGLDSRAKIGGMHAPLLVMHGDRDAVIPLRLGQDLFAAALEPKSFWLVPGAGHNDIAEVAGLTYRERLRSFYDGLAKASR